MYNPSLYSLNTAYPFYPGCVISDNLKRITAARIVIYIDDAAYDVNEILSSICITTIKDVLGVLKAVVSYRLVKDGSQHTMNVNVYELNALISNIDSFIIGKGVATETGANAKLLPNVVVIAVAPPKLNGITGGTIKLTSVTSDIELSKYAYGSTTTLSITVTLPDTDSVGTFTGLYSINGIGGDVRFSSTRAIDLKTRLSGGTVTLSIGVQTV